VAQFGSVVVSGLLTFTIRFRAVFVYPPANLFKGYIWWELAESMNEALSDNIGRID